MSLEKKKTTKHAQYSFRQVKEIAGPGTVFLRAEQKSGAGGKGWA